MQQWQKTVIGLSSFGIVLLVAGILGFVIYTAEQADKNETFTPEPAGDLKLRA